MRLFTRILKAIVFSIQRTKASLPYLGPEIVYAIPQEEKLRTELDFGHVGNEPRQQLTWVTIGHGMFLSVGYNVTSKNSNLLIIKALRTKVFYSMVMAKVELRTCWTSATC